MTSQGSQVDFTLLRRTSDKRCPGEEEWKEQRARAGTVSHGEVPRLRKSRAFNENTLVLLRKRIFKFYRLLDYF